MRKIILFVLIVGGSGWLAQMISAKHMYDYSGACLASLNVLEKLKTIRTNSEVETLQTDLSNCISSKQTFVDSIFFNKNKIREGLKITPASTLR